MLEALKCKKNYILLILAFSFSRYPFMYYVLTEKGEKKSDEGNEDMIELKNEKRIHGRMDGGLKFCFLCMEYLY